MQKVTRILFVILLFSTIVTKDLIGQIGGGNTYDFLNLTNSARIAAMGGNFLSINDGDITLAIANPSLIDSTMDQNLVISIVDYYSDITYGFSAYSRTLEKLGTFVGTVQFVNYGRFNYADDTGFVSGRFGASEIAAQLGWAKLLAPKWRVGSNFKFVYSAFEGYNSYGIAFDLAASYLDVANHFSSSLMIKNAGCQIKAYRTGNNENFPIEIQFALSKRLKHLPFRYSVLVNHLNKWDLTYADPGINNSFLNNSNLEAQNANSNFSDKLFRHIVVGGELLLSDNFIVRLGYNYKRRKELGIESKMSTVGFSWGFEFKISRFRLSYARSTYHLAGSPNYITIMTNLSDFFSK